MSVDISVIIPTYYPTILLHNCLESISKQTFDFKKYEIIIVLNGDISSLYKKIVEDEIRLYPLFDITLICTEIASVSNARNMALDVVKGKYICFIDDDDIISETYLANMYKLIDSKSVVVSDVLAFNNNSIQDVVPDYITEAYRNLSFHKSISNKLIARSFFSSSCCKLIPMNIISNRRFDINFKIGEDSLFMALISDRIENIIFADNTVIYYRRIRESSAYHKKESFYKKLITSFLISMSFVKIYVKSPFKYDFLFFINRILAPFSRLFIKK